jgi:hypothetical protein
MNISKASEIRDVLVGHLSSGKIEEGLYFSRRISMSFLSYFV